MILIIYFLTALGSYGNIVIIYYKLLLYNLLKSLKIVFSKREYSYTSALELKIKITKIIFEKLHVDLKKFEIVVTSVTIVIVAFFPVVAMIIAKVF